MPDESLLQAIVEEIRFTNRLLTLALGDSIASRIRSLLARSNAAAVIAALEEGDAATEEVQKRAADRGVSRSSFYRVAAELERSGVVERPQRGWLALSPVVLAILPAARSGPVDDQGDQA
jgi:hypothetical protein